MKQIELYDRRIDWLVAAFPAILLIWLFYGFGAALIGLLVFILIGALKPLIAKLGSRMASGVFAAGTILLLSPLLQMLGSFDLYDIDGKWSLSEFGVFRDLAMPVAGLGLILCVWLDRPELTNSDTSRKSAAGHRFRRWAVLTSALILWIGGSIAQHYFEQAADFRAAQEALEAQQQAEIAERARQAAAAAEEARRMAAEKAAKRVDLKWLIGAWVEIGGQGADLPDDLETYCATDNAAWFKANGQYGRYDVDGKYVLEDGQIRLSKLVRTEYGVSDAIPEYLQPVTLKVERRGDALIIDGRTYGRCK